MKRILIGIMLGLSLVMTAAGSAVAGGEDPPVIDAVNGDNLDEVDVTVTDPTSGPVGGPSSDPVYRVPGPWTNYKYVPTCSSNSANEGTADVLCSAAVSTCPSDRDIRYSVSTMKMGANDKPIDGADAQWVQNGESVCLGPDDPREGGPAQITEAMVFDKAREAAPDTVVNVEPKTKSYVNVPTNFYADDATVTKDITVLGVGLSVTFDPSGFLWTFGDGSTASGAGVKAARVGAAGAVEHVYRRSGDYDVSLSRSFAVTVQLPGGEVLTLSVPLKNASVPYPLEIGEVQSVVTNVN